MLIEALLPIYQVCILVLIIINIPIACIFLVAYIEENVDHSGLLSKPSLCVIYVGVILWAITWALLL